MNETLQIIFGLFGGLAIFLYGMNLMSDSLQKVAGERMRTILGMLTKNPVLGVLSGALVTAVLQSSSATTVMGHRLRQRWADVAATGHFYHLWCKHRDDDDRAADCV